MSALGERTASAALRAVDRLPERVALRLAGHVHEVDGDVLDPRLALLMRGNDRAAARADTSVPGQRTAAVVSTRVAAGPPVPCGSVRDITIDGSLRARHYAPPGDAQRRPLLVWFHGGGWVVGDLTTADQPCRLLARHGGLHVLSIDYRLAPEDPFPAAVDDALMAFTWAREHASSLGAGVVCVGGDSAGGNLAAVVAQSTRGGDMPAAQLLAYPVVDVESTLPSTRLFANGYLLTMDAMEWYRTQYAPGVDARDPRLSPLHADSLAGLPPALVCTAAFDPLRDEGEEYALRMRGAGVPVATRRASGLVHGFMNITGIHRRSHDETVAMIGAFAALVDALPGAPDLS